MINKADLIAVLDRFLDKQRARFTELVVAEDYEYVSFRSGYVEGLEMAKAIILASKEEEDT